MNILQEIDSTLHYENIEKAWHKYKYAFMLALVALFGGVAGFNAYNANALKTAEADTKVIFDVMLNSIETKDSAEIIIPALDELKTQQAKDMLNLELAKVYKQQDKTDEYEMLLKKLITAKTKVVKQLSVYMLAELYLAQQPTKVIELVNSANLSKKAATYALVQELKAMALAATGSVDQAKEIYTVLIADTANSAEFKARVQIKLDQLG